jgi:hypothetical protein
MVGHRGVEANLAKVDAICNMDKPSNKKDVMKLVDGRLSYQSSYGFASGQIHRRSQGTPLPSSGVHKVSNPWNNVQRKDSI